MSQSMSHVTIGSVLFDHEASSREHYQWGPVVKQRTRDCLYFRKRALHSGKRALHLGTKPPYFCKKVLHLGKRALYLYLTVTLEEPPPLPQAIASLLFDHEPSALFVGRSWPRLVAGDSTGHVYMMQVCCSVLYCVAVVCCSVLL